MRYVCADQEGVWIRGRGEMGTAEYGGQSKSATRKVDWRCVWGSVGGCVGGVEWTGRRVWWGSVDAAARGEHG